jgi:hypothetical protein
VAGHSEPEKAVQKQVQYHAEAGRSMPQGLHEVREHPTICGILDSSGDPDGTRTIS